MLPDRALVVAPAAGSWRRALVPSAWVVLEELAVAASNEGVLSTNVRQLGAALGLSKDTAARALRTLIRVGLVERLDERDAGSGRFGWPGVRGGRAERVGSPDDAWGWGAGRACIRGLRKPGGEVPEGGED